MAVNFERRFKVKWKSSRSVDPIVEGHTTLKTQDRVIGVRLPTLVVRGYGAQKILLLPDRKDYQECSANVPLGMGSHLYK